MCASFQDYEKTNKDRIQSNNESFSTWYFGYWFFGIYCACNNNGGELKY